MAEQNFVVVTAWKGTTVFGARGTLKSKVVYANSTEKVVRGLNDHFINAIGILDSNKTVKDRRVKGYASGLNI